MAEDNKSPWTVRAGINGKHNDDWYWNEVQKYKNSPLYDTLLKNPYLVSNNSEYSPTLGASIAQLFGDYSAEDAYYQELRSKANGYLADTVRSLDEAKYEDPASELARRRAAGLNDDLSGGQAIGSGSLGENDQPFSPVSMPSSPSPLQAVQSVGGMFLQAYSFASGLAKDMFSFKNLENQVLNEDIKNTESMRNLALDFVSSHVGAPRYNEKTRSYDFPDLALDVLDRYTNEHFHSRLAKRRFKDEVNRRYSSALAVYNRFGIISDAVDASTKVGRSLGEFDSYGGQHNIYNVDPIVTVSKELNDLSIKVEKARKKFEVTSSDFHREVLENTDPEKAGQATDSANEASIKNNSALQYQYEVDKIINSTISTIVGSLSKDAKSDSLNGIIAKGILLFVSAMRSGLVPSLPAVNFNKTDRNYFNTTNNNL